MSDLQILYQKIANLLDEIDFSALWPDFHPFPFALYNQEEVVIDNEKRPITPQFIGNTAIKWEESWLAIWNIQDASDNDYQLLTAKLVHEMFHAFQYEQKEKRFPNEMDGLRYGFSALNLTIKYQENLLLGELSRHFTNTKWDEFIKRRNYRALHFPKQVDYESKIEVVEGMAQFVEMQALKQIDEQVFIEEHNKLLLRLLDQNRLLKIRHLSYDVGTMLLLIMDAQKCSFKHRLGEETKTIFAMLSQPSADVNFDFKIDEQIESLLKNDFGKKQAQITKVLETGKSVNKDFKIIGFDPLNAFIIDPYLYNPHFVMI